MHFVVEVLTVNQISQYQHGGSETSAALEFAVNTLQVQIYCDIYLITDLSLFFHLC
jgi:hypothetical protein